MAASRVACASFNIGTNTTISITRDNKNYTHTLTFKFGSYTGTVATKTTSTSVVWTPNASELYKQIPNAVSGYGTITCQTYNGSTLIGTTTAGFYAYAVKSSCLPTVSATIVDTNATTIALTGDSTKLIGFISKPKVTLTATPKNSATIKTIFIHSYGSGLTADTSPYTFSTVYSDEFICRAIDSRGYITEITHNAPYVDYKPCHFNNVVLKRTETTSTTANAVLEGYCFNGNFGASNNTLTIKYRYKTSTGSFSNYTTLSGVIWNSDGTFSLTTNMTSLSLNETYTFEFVIEDKLTTFSSEDVVLTQGVGDLRIAKDYVMTKNNMIVGDINNEDWKCFKARRKRDGINYDANFGAGFGGGGITAVMEVNQIVDGVETKLARYDLQKDGYLYNWLTNMSVAEMESYAPSTVAGAPLNGRLLLNGGNTDPILVQWGRVNITPTAANTVTKVPINFLHTYQGIPLIKTQAVTSAPATIDVDPGDITGTGFNIYLQRTNTVSTSVVWYAIGNGTPSLPE